MTSTMRVTKIWSLLSIVLLLAAGLTACTSTNQSNKNQIRIASPQQAVDQGTTGMAVRWGGRVLSVTNKSNKTRLEVLAYPLSGITGKRIKLNKEATGRFLVNSAEFLEPEDFSSGQLVLVEGELTAFEDGEIGSATYTYPVIDAVSVARATEATRWYQPVFSIGVGIEL